MFLKLLVNFRFAFVSKLRVTIFLVNFRIFSIFLSFAWKKTRIGFLWSHFFLTILIQNSICLECSLPYCAVKFIVLLNSLPGNFWFSIHRTLPWQIHHVTWYWIPVNLQKSVFSESVFFESVFFESVFFESVFSENFFDPMLTQPKHFFKPSVPAEVRVFRAFASLFQKVELLCDLTW